MIKKFLNPSGKLTYEEALRQAGERVESLTRPSILVKGVNNSNRRVPNVRERAKGRARIRNREREELILRYNLQNEMQTLVPSGKHYDPVADEDVTDYSNVNGPKVIGMSGVDPLMEFYVGGEALGPLFKLIGKGALYGLGRYYRGTNYGDWAAAKLIAPEMNKALISNSLKLIPSLSQYISLTQQPIRLNESGLTSLRFLERPSKITEAERLGIPKGERNFRPKWHVANYPGYLLKGLMRGSQLEKLLSKNGTININLLNAYFNKASQIEKDVANKVLTEKFAGLKTIDYNLFKKAVLDELITYNRNYNAQSMIPTMTTEKMMAYGGDRLGIIKDFKNIPDGTGGVVTTWTEELPVLFKQFTFETPKISIGNRKHYSGQPIGHTRTFTNQQEPLILHVMESQSDWAQKSLGLTKAEKTAIQNIDEQLKTGTPTGFSTLEELQAQKQAILDRASQRTQGISYLSLHLHDNYLQRQLQENLRYAAENGLTKMRYPTSETAAKIEGYSKLDTFEFEPGFEETGKNITNRLFAETRENPNEYGLFDSEEFAEALNNEQDNRKLLSKIFEGRGVKNPSETLLELMNKARLLYKYTKDYKPAHKTILKKYADFPKLFLKLFKDLQVRTVTDTKGNTWYEVDVPKGYLNREWLFKQGGKMNTILFLKLIHKKGGKLLKID